MKLQQDKFLKFNKLLPIYNWTYPLFRNLEDGEQYNQTDLSSINITPKTLTLYFHIPFCETLCSFCPFIRGKYKNMSEIDTYIDALIKEIEFKAPFFKNNTVDCIYIGGGTPSLMGEANLEKLVHAISKNYNLAIKEFTFETEAKSVDENLLNKAKNLGVSRISIGAQTFNTYYREAFNLTISATDLTQKIKAAINIISNTGIDILYGMRGQSTDDFISDLSTALSLNPKTINLYPINNLIVQASLFKELNKFPEKTLMDKKALLLLGDAYLQANGYHPCNGHTYIKTEESAPDPENYFLYHTRLHGYQDDFVIGHGCSAQSFLGNMVSNNNPNRNTYIEQAEKQLFECHTYLASDAEIYSKPLTMRLPYNGSVNKNRLNLNLVDPGTHAKLIELIEHDLIAETDTQYMVTLKGQMWYTNLMYYLLPNTDQIIVSNAVEGWSTRKEYQKEKEYILEYMK